MKRKMMYKVYYTMPGEGGVARSETFASNEMSEALVRSQILRNSGATFVVMASENVDQVGRMGVDAVIDGKLPSGETYDWKKRRV
jgi:hypothetical protein